MNLPKPPAPTDKQLREWNQWIDKLLDTALLTHWEQSFVEDLERQLASGYTLSIKQAEVLEQLYVKKG